MSVGQNDVASITTRSYEKLIVTDKEAERVQKDKLETQDELLKRLPYVIHHDDGLWSGSLMDIGPITSESKRQPTHYLKREDIERFHNKHGYGKYKSEYIPGYGLLDIATQYMIGTQQAKLEDIGGRKVLKLLKKNEAIIKWEELWEDYQLKLDEFNELRQPHD